MTYLITFACYGCHLHGQESGSVDRGHNLPEVGCWNRREAVLVSLQERCSRHCWSLLAAHVRGNHVHVVVEADARPERIMNDLKAYASRWLNRMGLDQPARKRWARHGSTRGLWKSEDISAAIRYVVDGQGEPMAVFEATEPWRREAATAPSGRGSA